MESDAPTSTLAVMVIGVMAGGVISPFPVTETPVGFRLTPPTEVKQEMT